MSKIRNEIATIIQDIKQQANRNVSSYSKMKKLSVLASNAGSNCSETFIDLVEILSQLNTDETVDLEEALALQEIFDADQILAEIPSEDENADLSRFSLKDVERQHITKKCDQMRKIVWASSTFDLPHRNRLLKRISAIEIELSKETGLYDVILGGISDFGEVAGKFGNDVKPLVDRMREIAGLVRKHTPDYDKLPAPDEIKKLPPPQE